ncbi:19582_t:CDS:2, partial [Gigaspora rosea]
PSADEVYKELESWKENLEILERPPTNSYTLDYILQYLSSVLTSFNSLSCKANKRMDVNLSNRPGINKVCRELENRIENLTALERSSTNCYSLDCIPHCLSSALNSFNPSSCCTLQNLLIPSIFLDEWKIGNGDIKISAVI